MDEPSISKRYVPPAIDLSHQNSSQTCIINLTGSGKNVLEIGTSTGYVSKILKKHGNTVSGIEIDKEAGLKARLYCDRIIIGDIEALDLEKHLEPSSFDVIICGDVLEHLKNPARVLKKMHKFLKSGGYLVVSLPNFCHGDVFFQILKGDFHYTPIGLLDETHLRFFGLKNIYNLFGECGYQVTDLHTINLEIGTTEIKTEQEKIPHELLKFIQSLPNSNVYQFVFRAYPTSEVKIPEFQEIDFKELFYGSFEESGKWARSQINFSEKEAQFQKMSAHVTDLEQEMRAIKNSITWQTVTKVHKKFVERFLPMNTKRRMIFDKGLKNGSSALLRLFK